MLCQYPQEAVNKYYQEVQSPMFIGIDGTYLTEQTQNLLNEVKPRGVILVSENVADYEQTKSLITSIKDYGETLGIDIKIATDEEGSLVARLKKIPEYPEYTSPSIYVQSYYSDCINSTDSELMPDCQAGTQKVDTENPYNHNEITTYIPSGVYEQEIAHTQFMKDLGIDINFAPVADIAFGQDSIMINRSLGYDVSQSSTNVGQYVSVQRDGGIMTTLKHFPGHGRTNYDTHFQIAPIYLDYATWLDTDSKPFVKGIEKGSEYIMTGHLMYPDIDNNSASVSSKWIRDVLRGDLKYKGWIITDDIKMQGMTKAEGFSESSTASWNNRYYPDMIKQSLNAGNNYVILILSESDMLDVWQVTQSLM